MTMQRSGGGTTVQARRSLAPLVAFLAVTPVVAYLIHEPSSACGWSWSGTGGACRAIILISILFGLAAGGLAVGCARAIAAQERRRAAVLGALVIVAAVVGMLAAKQFADYRGAAARTIEPRP